MKFKRYIKYITSLFALLITGCTVTFNSTSNALSVYKEPDKTIYFIGESFSLDGIKVIDSFGLPVTEYASSIKEGYVFEETGLKEVILTKANYTSTSFNIEVVEQHSLKVKELPSKTSYFVSEAFSSAGLYITDEKSNTIGDYTLSLEEGYIFQTPGEITVDVTKDLYESTSFKITVEKSKELIILNMPNKTTFKVGDNFTSEGLVVGDDKGATNLPFTTSIANGDTLKHEGEITVVISVEGYLDISYKITVEKSEAPVTKKDQTINVYYINDTHGTFTRDEENYAAGMAYISRYMRDRKEDANDNAIIVSGGDMLQGGFESNQTRGKIMIEAMNVSQFDVMTCGNHEFDWGEEAIKEALALANFPVISANIFRSDRITRPEWLTPYTIVERGDIKIGFVGFAQENLGSSITGSIAQNFYFPKPNEYVKEYATALRTSYNCDLVLAVGHDGGVDDGETNPTRFSDLVEVNPKTGSKYVDGLFFAHDHRRKSGTYNDVPFMETACNGKYIGQMTFNMENNGVVYQVKSTNVTTNSATYLCKTEDSDVTSLLEKYAEFLSDPDRVITTFTQSYTKEQFARLVCQAMIWFVNKNSSEFGGSTVNFGTHNLGGIRVSEVPAGDFTYKDLIQVCPFDNPITIQKLYKSHVDRLKSSSSLAYYQSGEITYKNNITEAVTISYIAEGSTNNQISYIEYPNYYSRDAVEQFLMTGQQINV